ERVLLSDSMAHLPPEVLSKNFGVAEAALKNLPKQELFIFQTAVPGSLEADQKAAAGALGKSSSDFAFRTMDMPPTKRTKGGEVRIVDSNTFKVSTNVAMAMVTVHAGGLRELHWHPNADEWQYYIAGQGRMTVVSTGNRTARWTFRRETSGTWKKPCCITSRIPGTQTRSSWKCSSAASIKTFRFRIGWPTPRPNW